MIEANDIKEYINAAIQTEETATHVNHDTSDRKNENGILHDLIHLVTSIIWLVKTFVMSYTMECLGLAMVAIMSLCLILPHVVTWAVMNLLGDLKIEVTTASVFTDDTEGQIDLEEDRFLIKNLLK